MSKSCALPKSVFPLKFKVRSPVHALQLARELIRPIRNWTIGELAIITEKGEESEGTSPKDPRAEAFCALGALLRVNSRHERAAESYLAKVAGSFPEASDLYGRDAIFEINDAEGDRNNHRRVLRMFDKAIELAKAASRKRKR